MVIAEAALAADLTIGLVFKHLEGNLAPRSVHRCNCIMNMDIMFEISCIVFEILLFWRPVGGQRSLQEKWRGGYAWPSPDPALGLGQVPEPHSLFNIGPGGRPSS